MLRLVLLVPGDSSLLFCPLPRAQNGLRPAVHRQRLLAPERLGRQLSRQQSARTSAALSQESHRLPSSHFSPRPTGLHKHSTRFRAAALYSVAAPTDLCNHLRQSAGTNLGHRAGHHRTCKYQLLQQYVGTLRMSESNAAYLRSTISANFCPFPVRNAATRCCVIPREAPVE